MDADIAQLQLHPTCRGAALPRPSAALLDLTVRHGVLQPVLVRPLGERRYEILVHADVWLAAQATGRFRVPIEVLEDIDDETALELVVATARQGRPLDLARRYARLLETERRGRVRGAVVRVARASGVPPSRVSRAIRVLGLPATLLEAVDRGVLTFGHAYALLACPDDDARLSLGRAAIDERLSVRALERRVRERGGARPAAAPDPAPPVSSPARPPTARADPVRSPDTVRLERQIADQIGTPVTLDEHAGTLTIDYRGSLDVLEGLLDRLGVTVT